MKSVRALFALALPVVFAGAVSAQAAVVFLGNETQLSNGGEFVFIYGSPSVGGTVGAPIVGADCAYTGLPENRMRTAAGTANLNTFEDIFIGDVDWPGGAPDFYDIGIDTTSAEFGVALDNLIPDFFATGSLNALLSLGNSGFPHPCVQSPTSTCSGSTGCPPLITGYITDIVLGSPLALPNAGASDTLGTSTISFLPGGMTFGATSIAGSCGSGDYVFQNAQSVDENQADYLNQAGTAWCEGFQLGDPAGISPSGPLEDSNLTCLEFNFGLIENVVEAEVSDSGIGYGPERGGSSFGIDTSTGTASVAAHVTTSPDLAGSLVFPTVSLSALPFAVPVFGANLLNAPDGTFNSTFAAYSGTGFLVGVDETGDGINDQAEAVSISLPLPIIAGRAHMQAFIVTGTGPITAVETTQWTFDLR